jgi:hypothetical protein
MAAKKKKKKAAKKAVKVRKTAAKKKKAPARKKKAPARRKKAAKKATTAKAARKGTAKKSTAKKSAAKKKPAPRKAKKPARPRQTVGEGDYAATRAFDADQAAFVKRNKGAIPQMGKAAEAALDGPEGKELRDAEAEGLARSRDLF